MKLSTGVNIMSTASPRLIPTEWGKSEHDAKNKQQAGSWLGNR